MNKAIEFKNIKKAYGSQVILENFDFSVEKGDFVTIIGSSGSGKTTVLKMANGLVKADAGDIFINGENIRDKDMIELRRNIGYAIQGSVLFPHMTVEQNISYVPNLLNKKDKKRTREALGKWMEIVGLEEELKERYPAELSGGQQQRVAVARAIAARPPVILADEPTGNLDSHSTAEIIQILKGLHKAGKTVIVITHDPDIAAQSRRVVRLEDGKIVEDYMNEEYKSDDDAGRNLEGRDVTGKVKTGKGEEADV